jgi:hypothetical protein
MAEPTQFSFTFKELAAALVKEAGLTSGIWGIQVRFGISARNVGGTEQDIVPAAIVPIVEIGLQKFDRENNLSVDASVISGLAKDGKTLAPSGRPRKVAKA